jgi:hypothetical protein
MAHTLRYIAYKRDNGKWGVGLWDFMQRKIVDPLAGEYDEQGRAQRVADKMNSAMSVIAF